MKELTAAYEAGDLHTLLRIEREWIDREATGMRSLPEARLKAYLAALKEQSSELEAELAMVQLSPRYESIAAFLVDDPTWSRKRIDAALRSEKRRIKLLESLAKELSFKMDKQDFIALVRELAEG